MISLINEIIYNEKDSANLLNLLCSLGNLLFNNQEYQGIARDMDVVSNLEEIKNIEGTEEDSKIVLNMKQYLTSLIKLR
jgi:hypothetical protein